jgi:undecaprenyl-diphosphatase
MQALFVLEQPIVIYINQLAISSGFLLTMGRFFSVVAIFILVGFFLISFFIDWESIRVSSKLLLFEGALAAGSAWIINQLVGFFFVRERPYIALEKVQLLIPEPVFPKSFPSDHATVAFALALVVMLWSPRLGTWMLLLALLIALSRVVVGVHYPTDILAGMLIGSVTAWFIHRFFI